MNRIEISSLERYYPSEGTLGNHHPHGADSDLVGLPDVMVQAGTHLATYFSSEAGRLRVAVPFLRDGIMLGQPCFLIATGKVLDSYVKALEKDVKAELAEARRRNLFATAPTPATQSRKPSPCGMNG